MVTKNTGLLVFIVLLLGLLTHASFSQELYLVKDINPGFADSFPSQFTVMSGKLYYFADDGIHGKELWWNYGGNVINGLVKDIYPGTGYYYYNDPFELTAAGSMLYFTADDNIHGRELWKSNGTEGGIVLVKDIVQGTLSSQPLRLTAVNSLMFFSVDDGIHGRELWKSDGTEVGTVLVKDVYSGLGGLSSDPRSLIDVNGTLFFSAYNIIYGRELWKSDGTEAGTVLVKDINPGTADSAPGYMAAVNGVLFFNADDGIHGHELWKSDGTESGTVLVKDIDQGYSSSESKYFTAVNGIVFFTADDGVHGRELWKTDGTESGTVLVKDIYPGNQNYWSQNPYMLTVSNGTLFFVANDAIHGHELWKSDGTEANTVLVKDIFPGPLATGFRVMTDFNGTLYFAASYDGVRLWKSDGTAAGTTSVKKFFEMHQIATIDELLFMDANDLTHGHELWVLDTAKPLAPCFKECDETFKECLKIPHTPRKVCEVARDQCKAACRKFSGNK